MTKKKEETKNNEVTKENEEIKKYIVLHDFTDLEDNRKVYKKDDVFPKPANKKISEERISELLSSDNGQGRPVIKAVD